jgi:hypothetical protein
MDDLDEDGLNDMAQEGNPLNSCADDPNTMKNIGMDEVTPEGLTYHVNTIELEVER